MPHLSITRLRLRRFWHLPAFLVRAGRSAEQVRGADGFLTGYTAMEKPFAFWAVTLWRDAEAKRAFYLAGAHRDAMPTIAKWCDEASVATLDGDETELPAPDEAAALMKAHGRLTTVPKPSTAQARGVIWASGKVPSSAGGLLSPTVRSTGARSDGDGEPT